MQPGAPAERIKRTIVATVTTSRILRESNLAAKMVREEDKFFIG
jgi:hypothetical protein